MAGVGKEAVNYLRSSASDYLGTEGVLDIDILERHYESRRLCV